MSENVKKGFSFYYKYYESGFITLYSERESIFESFNHDRDIKISFGRAILTERKWNVLLENDSTNKVEAEKIKLLFEDVI